MKKLFLLRHAEAIREPGLADIDRPLTSQGQEQARKLADILLKNSLIPDLIITSTAVRALKTAEIVIKQIGYQSRIEKSLQLYESDSLKHISVIQSCAKDESSVMIIGHNPVLEELLSSLTESQKHLSTGSLAELELMIGEWKELSLKTSAILLHLYK